MDAESCPIPNTGQHGGDNSSVVVAGTAAAVVVAGNDYCGHCVRDTTTMMRDAANGCNRCSRAMRTWSRAGGSCSRRRRAGMTLQSTDTRTRWRLWHCWSVGYWDCSGSSCCCCCRMDYSAVHCCTWRLWDASRSGSYGDTRSPSRPLTSGSGSTDYYRRLLLRHSTDIESNCCCCCSTYCSLCLAGCCGQ